MATREVLAELAAQFQRQSDCAVLLESAGGVDVAKRVAAGEAVDVVVLAAKTIDDLIAAGRLSAASRTDIVKSGIAVAVRAGAPVPDIGSAEALKRAVLQAATISYSTGPSGVEGNRGKTAGIGRHRSRAPPNHCLKRCVVTQNDTAIAVTGQTDRCRTTVTPDAISAFGSQGGSRYHNPLRTRVQGYRSRPAIAGRTSVRTARRASSSKQGIILYRDPVSTSGGHGNTRCLAGSNACAEDVGATQQYVTGRCGECNWAIGL